MKAITEYTICLCCIFLLCSCLAHNKVLMLNLSQNVRLTWSKLSLLSNFSFCLCQSSASLCVIFATHDSRYAIQNIALALKSGLVLKVDSKVRFSQVGSYRCSYGPGSDLRLVQSSGSVWQNFCREVVEIKGIRHAVCNVLNKPNIYNSCDTPSTPNSTCCNSAVNIKMASSAKKVGHS